MKRKKISIIGALVLGLVMSGCGSVATRLEPVRLNAGETDVTYKLTIQTSDFNTTSYAANNNEKTTKAVCVTDSTKKMDVKWTSYQVYQSQSKMQWQKNKGYIYNSTDLGTITDLSMTAASGTFTTFYGTAEEPSEGEAGTGKGFFKTSIGNATGYCTQIEITFTISESPQEDVYNITFDTDDGTPVPPNQTAPKDGSGKVSIPSTEPTKAGYNFEGWFHQDLTTPFDFTNTFVTSDLTIYAKWSKVDVTVDYSSRGDKALTSGNGYRIQGEVTAIVGTSTFFIQNGDNSMQIYDKTATEKVAVGNSVDVFGTYIVNSNYCEIKDVAYCDILSDDTTISTTPITNLDNVNSDNDFKYFSIPKIQLDSGFTDKKANIKGSTVVVFYNNQSYVNGGSFTPANFVANDYVAVTGVIVVFGSTLELSITSINKLSQFIVTFDGNGVGSSSTPSQTVLEGDKVSLPTPPTREPDENNTYEFAGWYLDAQGNDPYNFDTIVDHSFILYAKWNPTPLSAQYVVENRTNTRSALSFSYNKSLNNENNITDSFDKSTTGVTGTGYSGWTKTDADSGVNYSGKSAGNNESIQLNSNDKKPGIVTTANSGNRVIKSIVINWNSNTAEDRFVTIYGKNTAYSNVTDLYGNNKGTEIGTATCNASHDQSVINFTYSYKFIGVYAPGALYIDSIDFVWGDAPTYSYSDIAIRFGGLITKSLWNKLVDENNGIEGFGVLFSTKKYLDDNSADMKDYVEMYDHAKIRNFYHATNVLMPADAEDSQKGNLEGECYVWNLYKNVSLTNINKEYASIAYIKTGTGYVFFKQAVTTVKTLAQQMLDSDPTNDAKYGGALSDLVSR